MDDQRQQNPVEQNKKKMVVGWFSFTCCEDSTILFTELLNDNLDSWKKLVEFRHLKALKTHNSLKDLDVAFIEGAVSSDTQAAEVKKIRENAKYVVAIGACACTGMPSASRNTFTDTQINERIQWYLNHFDYSTKVRKLSEVIQVDDMVEGCPMNVQNFYDMLNKYLKITGVA
jgi:coenzyme F420-reducing hydrogenase gamma subunit